MPSRRTVLRRGVAAVGAGGTVALFRATGGSSNRPDGTARALVAGSLLSVATEVPGATVEAHGSLAVRQLVDDDARDPDAVALADPALFAGLVDRVRLFASNALVVAYDPESSHADAIRADWTRALAAEDLALGRTDPEIDPLGYRTVLALRLADRLGIADPSLLSGSTVLPETNVLRNLEAGELDAAFVYRNMAVEHGVPAVDLPAAIDFSDPVLADEYATVSLELDDRTVRGGPIRYGAAALTDAGRGWVDRLVSGTDRLADHGFVVPEDYPATRPVADLADA